MLRPFSYGTFGNIPSPPEPPECDGEFYEDKCVYCSNHDECKKECEDNGQGI